ncbi:hypothetical protein GRF29_69g234916 [Pseudopithomyces chartarum]|uniref:Uncharacterized protein n=1 Tax=Pseudopithomyces chartarum TaxID=1892770 RepID=A0AAN6M0D9_9PLEO|nr:hypothetical protein GRF29_69g234916 [Pseudopithomyces chartarum]
MRFFATTVAALFVTSAVASPMPRKCPGGEMTFARCKVRRDVGSLSGNGVGVSKLKVFSLGTEE